VGYCTLSVTYPGKPLPALLLRQCPTHIIRRTLDRLHYSEKCTYAFTVQMGLLAFFGKKYMYEGLFIAVQQHFGNMPGCAAALLAQVHAA